MNLFRHPLISFIIPCYNTEKYIDECIESVVHQTLRDIEIICVDDGSVDGTLDILRQWEKNDSRVKVITKENGGVSAARNIGFQAARGTFVYYLDSDDLIADTAIFGKMCRIMQSENLDVCMGGVRTFFDSAQLAKQFSDYEKRYQINHEYPSVLTGPESIVQLRKNGDWAVTTGLKILRKSFMEKNHLRFLEGYIHEDALFTMEVLFLARKVRITNQTFYKRRIREQSLMTAPTSFFNTLSYITIFIEELRFLEAHRDVLELDARVGQSIAVAKRKAVSTYLKLDASERKLLDQKMDAEQRFYFTSFFMPEIDLTIKVNSLSQKSG